MAHCSIGLLSKRPNQRLQPTVTSGLRPLVPAAELRRRVSEARMHQVTLPGILLGIVAAAAIVALVFVLPDVIAQVLPQHQVWVRDHIHQIVAGITTLVVTAIIFSLNRGTGKYKPGDDPLAVARMIAVFGRKKMAIRYLESVPHEHPRASEVQMQIHKLQKDI